MFGNSSAADLTGQFFGSGNPDWRPSVVGPTGNDAVRAGTPMPAPRQRGMFAGGGARLDRSMLAPMLMALGGNHSGASLAVQIMSLRQRERAEQAETQRLAERRDSLFNNLVKRGVDPGDAELAMTNTEALGTEFNTRFRTREASEGESIYRPGFGQEGPTVWTAPRTFEQGADIVRLDPSRPGGEALTRFPGMTGPEQEARAIGLNPGAPGYETFIRDRALGAQGPTATGLARDRIGATIRGQDMTDARGRRGQDMTDARGRSSFWGSGGSSRGRGRQGGRAGGSEPVARGPDGRRYVVRNGQWVPVQ